MGGTLSASGYSTNPIERHVTLRDSADRRAVMYRTCEQPARGALRDEMAFSHFGGRGDAMQCARKAG